MQIDPRHLVQLATIVELGSFSKAAQALGTTQPGLSRMVADLERRLKVRLFGQRRRPLIATQIGRDLADQGLAIRAALADSEAIAGQARVGQRGLLRIGAPPFICDYALAQIVPEFQRAHAGVAFEITAAYSGDLRTMILQGQLDLALGLAGAATGEPRLRSRHLIDICHAIVCRGGHPLAARQGKASMRSLADAEWIGHADASKLGEVMRDALAMSGLGDFHMAVKSESAGVIVTLLRSSDALTVLPVFALLPAVESGDLAVVGAPLNYPLLPLYAITRRAAGNEIACDLFAEHLAGHFARMDARMQKIAAGGTRAQPKKAKP